MQQAGPQQVFFFKWWLNRPNESAHEFAVHLRGEGIHIEALPGEKFPRVLDAVDPRGFDFDLLKSGGQKFAAVFVLFESARDAAHPQQNALANFRAAFRRA